MTHPFIGLGARGARRFETGSIALVVGFCLVAGSLAASAMDRVRPAEAEPAPSTARAQGPRVAAALAAATQSSPFPKLPPLRLCNLNTRDCLSLALYEPNGRVDDAAADRLDSLLGDYRDPKQPFFIRMERRVLMLLYRTAYHFGKNQVEVVSAYRRPRRRHEGPHALGSAIDFKLPGVTAAALASYLRSLPRVGVGLYTHPRTQYVHLDVRDQSYHWLDASPPNRTWRERPLRSRSLQALDATYTLKSDWPEGATPPP